MLNRAYHFHGKCDTASKLSRWPIMLLRELGSFLQTHYKISQDWVKLHWENLMNLPGLADGC